MPLLLAIEPDAQRATRLKTCVSTHLGAELVVAATAHEALTMLQLRRPDLVLASPSVGPAELAALMAGLGAEVPSLAVPLLTTRTTTPRRARGLLTRLRRSHRRHEADACEPAAFAAQMAECLGLADAVRRAYAQATATPAGTPMLSAADAAATVIDLQVFAERERAEEPAVADGWLDLEPYLADEDPAATGPGGLAQSGPPEPDVIELPPPGELWAQLAPGDAARMAPLEGPSMAPGRQHATPRRASADLEGTGTAERLPSLLPAHAASDRPMQDEWGLYDPEQCGFAALLLRLAELADDDRREREHGDRSAIMRP